MKKLIATLVFLSVAGFLATSASAQAAVKFEILAPGDGQTLYGDKLPILFNVENFTLIDAQKPLANQGHILVWLDNPSKTAETATKVTSDTFTFSDIANGDHTLVAQLVTSDNKQLTPPQEIIVTFKTGQLPSSTPPEATTFDKKTMAVILVIVALVIIAAWWYTKDEDLEETPAKPAAAKKKTARKAKRR